MKEWNDVILNAILCSQTIELERKKIDKANFVRELRKRYFNSSITCMPSRAERGKFIKKYPILNPPAPKLKNNEVIKN